MGGIRRHDSPVGVKKGHVGFAEAIVSGYSRPLSNEEHWVLYYFEMHAVDCKTCYNPFKVFKTRGQLCEDGHELAVDVAELLFKLRDGDVYARSESDRQEVRVEVPAGYKHTMGLFKAIQHSSSFLRSTSHSDYPIKQRVPRPSRHDVPSQPTPYNTRILDPTIPEAPKRRKPLLSNDADNKAKRGSIYEDDLADLEEASIRERQARYSLEVRKPYYYRP